MDDNQLNELMKELKNIEDKKRKSIIHGDNVIHFDYLSGLIDEADLIQLKSLLKTASLQLSLYDKNGSPYNTLEDFALTMFLYISQPIVMQLITGISINTVYDCIKKSILLIHNKIINKEVTHTNGKISEQKKIKFGIKMNTPANGKFSFEFDGVLNEERIDDFFTKALDVYSKSDDDKSFYCVYDSESKILNKVDIMDEIRNKTNK